MTNEQTKVPVWFWVVAIILLIWNLMGVASFFVHMFITEDALLALPENERALYGQYPFWTKIAFAVAVFGGIIGSILLVIRRKLAKPVFILSLMAIIPQMGHSLLMTDSMEVYGNEAAVMPSFVILIGIFAVWLTNHSITKGWMK